MRKQQVRARRTEWPEARRRRNRKRSPTHAAGGRTERFGSDPERSNWGEGPSGKPSKLAKVRNQETRGASNVAKMSDVQRILAARQAQVDQNLDAFLKELPGLAKTHPGKIALLHDKKIVGFYDTVPDAVTTASAMFPDGMFSIQPVTQIPVELGFYSHTSSLGQSQ